MQKLIRDLKRVAAIHFFSAIRRNIRNSLHIQKNRYNHIWKVNKPLKRRKAPLVKTRRMLKAN